MTNKVQKEETPNPYNANKPWHKGKDKPFLSSDTMYFEEPSEKNKLFKTDNITEVEAEGSVNTEELETSRDTPYKKPDYKKRYDDLKKHYDSKLNEFKQREVELQNQARPEYVAPKTPEELERFKKEYPDFYEVVETVSHLQSDSKVKVLEERLSQLQSEEAKQRKSDAEKRLTERHPDFGDIRRSEDFHEWAKEQHTSIQAWIYDNADDADLASRALDLFKKDMGIDLPKVDRSSSKSKTNAADMVSTKTTVVDTKEPKVWTKREIDAMSMDEFDKYEKEISDAMQNGLISN